MQITPINYNYSNPKAQKNNSKPAFGMAMTKKMEECVAQHAEEIIDLGARGEKSVLDNLCKIIDHHLYIGMPHNGSDFRIYSGNTKAFRPVEQGVTFAQTIQHIASHLEGYDVLMRDVELQRSLYEEKDAAVLRQLQLLSNVRKTNTESLVKGKLRTPEACQEAERTVSAAGAELEHKRADKEASFVNYGKSQQDVGNFFTQQTEEGVFEILS